MVTLRGNQIDAADAVEAAWRSGVARPLVDSCVGSGKSLMFAELARREVERGGRVIIGAHTRELVEQNAAAVRMLGMPCGINAAALNQRDWRSPPIISAAIQSIYKHGASFGPVTSFFGDEAHLWPHSESGMYRNLIRSLGKVRVAGASGTVFRLQGGSLIEGEGAPFDRVVYRYSILDGIRDGYLCPAFSIGADDKIDPTKLRTRQGEFTGDSSDAQMIAAIDNHIAQMVYHGADRRAWLIFEASTKAARAMVARLIEWGVSAALVLGDTHAGERAATIEAFRAGRLRALVNVAALTTGFDVPHVDLLVMRRPTKSLGLYIQQVGRGLRCVGGNINASIAAGKSDCAVLDFAGNIDRHGPLDFLRTTESRPRLVSCEECGARCQSAAVKCWSCQATMLKNCPACLNAIPRRLVECPHCQYDMRSGPKAADGAGLSDTPSGAALIAAYRTGTERAGGWLPVMKIWSGPGGALVDVASGQRIELRGRLAEMASEARWCRADGSAILVPNGQARTSVRQVLENGAELIIPMPAQNNC